MYSSRESLTAHSSTWAEHAWVPPSIGKTWNACVFEIERPAGEERNRIRGAQRRGFFALRPQGAFHLEGARIPRLTCLENGKPLA